MLLFCPGKCFDVDGADTVERTEILFVLTDMDKECTLAHFPTFPSSIQSISIFFSIK